MLDMMTSAVLHAQRKPVPAPVEQCASIRLLGRQLGSRPRDLEPKRIPVRSVVIRTDRGSSRGGGNGARPRRNARHHQTSEYVTGLS